MGYWVEGNNSPLMKEIRKDSRLLAIFMEYAQLPEDQQELFTFIRRANGKLDIEDNRPPEIKSQTIPIGI